MLRIKKILFPTDFSKTSKYALSHVAEFAVSLGAEVHLLHVRSENKARVPGQFEERMAELKREIGSYPRVGSAQPLTLIAHKVTDVAPGHAIVEYAAKQRIDLIIFSTHGRRGIQRFFLGSVAEEVARSAPCSVVTVREAVSPDKDPSYRNIVVAVDFSLFSHDAVRCGAALAKLFGSQLHLLYVIDAEIPSIIYSVGRRSLMDLIPDLEEKAKKALGDLANELDCEDAKIHLSRGHVHRQIEKFVNRHRVDLLVIASHGSLGGKQYVMGSVAQMVIHYSSCPVLTLRSFGRPLITPDSQPPGDAG